MGALLSGALADGAPAVTRTADPFADDPNPNPNPSPDPDQAVLRLVEKHARRNGPACMRLLLSANADVGGSDLMKASALHKSIPNPSPNPDPNPNPITLTRRARCTSR